MSTEKKKIVVERYRHLRLSEALASISSYPLACSELYEIICQAYAKLPKTLQAVLFDDTLAAFRLLPKMLTSHALSAANLLLHAAEVAFPKHKRSLAVTEFKRAVVVHKRRFKPPKVPKGLAFLPEDVLAHVFSFLDMRSVLAASLVCWLWNSAATDNELWHLQYTKLFGNLVEAKTNVPDKQASGKREGLALYDVKEPNATSTSSGWKEEFKRKCLGTPRCKSTSRRGYCVYCKSIVWLHNTSCETSHRNLHRKRIVIHISSTQVVSFLMGDRRWLSSSSDNDDSGDWDVQWMEQQLPRFWAVPQFMVYE